ncbi:ECF RNA polymerase sigma-E factor [Labrenzia sp. THAF82]|uniref:RNA polymerase sigma factor n=1 Tax=Labrenzia sp. THAF82 TaxID=2587861 RepID=UPI0012A8D1DC|nr:RNA polymerase sigma factor [Labrenzia sp. THAF82]QFT34601.1 ECF RNA polymerase sigma-E factor [Labrenzia sp. THAF82]
MIANVSAATVTAAQNGDRLALEKVLSSVEDLIHGLARRILVNPEDAREATQEILIQILTKLSTFRNESSFSTWAYQVAVRYLVKAKKLRDRDLGLTFEMFAADLETGLVADPPEAPDQALLLNELRVSCTMAMLLCLSLDLRLAYVLGDVLELDHLEASKILELTPATFRKRLSRARAGVEGFTSRHCGLVASEAKCSCPRRLPAAINGGRVQAGVYPNSAESRIGYAQARQQIDAVVDDLKTFKLQHSVPAHACPDEIRTRLRRILSPEL